MQALKALFQPPTSSQLDDIRGIKHFYGIDLLRGLTAMVILVWHYQHFYYTTPMHKGSPGVEINKKIQPLYDFLLPFYQHGYWAVQLFWIISGFVFAHVYASRQTSTRDFAISRIARLYPLHVITLIAIAIFQKISLGLTGGYQVVPTNDTYHFFLNLFFISHWGFQDAISYNSPIWSVSVEIAIYILFFLVAKNIFSAGILFPLVLSWFGFAIVNRGTPLWFFAMCAMFFFMGVIIYYVLCKFGHKKKTILFICVASLAHFAHILMGADFPKKNFTHVEGFLLVPIVVAFACLDLSGRFQQALQRTKWIGDTTYSSYLWHFPIQVLILALVYYSGVDRAFFNSPITLLVWVAGMLIVARQSFLRIERPLQRATIEWAKKRLL